MDQADKPICIKIYIDPRKFSKMLELTPDYQKGKGEKSKIVYFMIDTAIASLLAPKVANQHHSNREYLRR
jgi:hypothetical protein